MKSNETTAKPTWTTIYLFQYSEIHLLIAVHLHCLDCALTI